jgi:hypothetical protein
MKSEDKGTVTSKGLGNTALDHHQSGKYRYNLPDDGTKIIFLRFA